MDDLIESALELWLTEAVFHKPDVRERAWRAFSIAREKPEKIPLLRACSWRLDIPPPKLLANLEATAASILEHQQRGHRRTSRVFNRIGLSVFHLPNDLDLLASLNPDCLDSEVEFFEDSPLGSEVAQSILPRPVAVSLDFKELELVEDIGDNRRCSLTAWQQADWCAIENALNTGQLPCYMRRQEFFEDKRSSGRAYYFYLGEEKAGLRRIRNWLNKSSRIYTTRNPI